MNETPQGEGLSKSGLLQEFWKFRRFFLWRIHRLISNPDTAEDIFQEACLKFLTSAAVFKHLQAGNKYFSLILRSLALQHLKSGRRIEYRLQLPEIVCEPQDSWEYNILLAQVSDAVATLPAKDQTLLNTYFRPGLTLDDKCKVLHLPNSTMRFQAKRTIAKVRKMVTEESKNSSGHTYQ
jgi:RNA polymerase sigma factor (sigma-70 family)